MEIASTGPLTGTIPSTESTTIKATRWAQISVLIGTVLTFLMDHVETISGWVATMLPPPWNGVALAIIQLLTALFAIFFGKQAINGRIEATRKVVVVKKSNAVVSTLMGPSKIAVIFCCLIAASAVPAHAQPKVTITWNYDGGIIKGFKMYKGGAAPAVLSVAQELPSEARSWSYTLTDSQPICFGITAFNLLGESTMLTQMDNGTPLCLVKPAAPKSLQFSVQ